MWRYHRYQGWWRLWYLRVDRNNHKTNRCSSYRSNHITYNRSNTRWLKGIWGICRRNNWYYRRRIGIIGTTCFSRRNHYTRRRGWCWRNWTNSCRRIRRITWRNYNWRGSWYSSCRKRSWRGSRRIDTTCWRRVNYRRRRELTWRNYRTWRGSWHIGTRGRIWRKCCRECWRRISWECWRRLSWGCWRGISWKCWRGSNWRGWRRRDWRGWRRRDWEYWRRINWNYWRGSYWRSWRRGSWSIWRNSYFCWGRGIINRWTSWRDWYWSTCWRRGLWRRRNRIRRGISCWSWRG